MMKGLTRYFSRIALDKMPFLLPIPTLYLPEKEKCVLLKNATPQQIERMLAEI